MTKVNPKSLLPGRCYKVTGYWTGDFIGRLEDVRFPKFCGPGIHPLTVLTIVDPLRPLPKVHEKCPFPFCVARDFHDGEHEFSTVRPGARIEVGFALARFEEVAADRVA